MSSKTPEVGHLRIVKAFEKAGFVVIRQGKHLIMRRGNVFISIPRHNPLKRFTLEGIVQDSGIPMREFLDLL